MIYIDPPYNTGKDFVYKDNFTKDKAEYDEESGNTNDEGGRLVSNPDSNGRYHSDWLSMMYPRLKLARNLLKDDGIVFISIDNNEESNLKKICDEIFGESNFISSIVIQSNPRGSQASSFFASVDERLICYAKNERLLSIRGYLKDDDDSDYNLIDDCNKKYRLLGLRQRGGAWKREDRPKMYYPIYVNPKTGAVSLEKTDVFWKQSLPARPTGEDSRWTWGVETFLENHKKLFGKKVTRVGNDDFWDIFRKDYLENESGSIKSTKPKTIWMDKEINYQNGRLEIKKLFSNSDLFDFPKPIFLFEKIIKIFDWNVSDIILDFFSGSATTAHAVMQLNAEDNGNRKFIMVQIPEATDEKSEAYKANYKTIAEIGKERIRRAGEKIKEDNADKKGIDDLDVGFRVLKVDSSNMRDVYYTPDNTKQSGLLDFDNIKVGRSDEDLLFQVLLDWGVDLTLKIERKDIDGKSVYFVDDDTLAACFEKNIDEDFVKELAKTQPLRVVFRDSSFTGDDVKINVEQIFKHTSEHTDIKVI
jgi:adenine-specific DNA-methyltransferase